MSSEPAKVVEYYWQRAH